MKFSAQREPLLAAVQTVIGVVQRRQTMPILSNFLLRLDPHGLTVVGTDLELELAASCDATVEGPGAVCVPARKLVDICRGFPADARVDFVLDEQRMRVSSGRSRFFLATLPAEGFPAQDTLQQGVALELERVLLKRLIDRTEFAMANQDVRYYLNGLLLVISSHGLRAVATNGHRLALSEAPAETGSDEMIQIIVPRNAVTELQRLLVVTTLQKVELRLTANHLQVTLPGLRLTTKLIDGRFPDYERVIPAGSHKRITGNREEFRQALARTAILANEKARGVRIHVTENLMHLYGQNPDRELAEDELDVVYDGEPLEVGFNVIYLLDALGAMDGQQFVLDICEPDNSGLLYEDSDVRGRYVVMPMRL